MKYIHPKHYEGVKFDNERTQKITRLKVENYCLKCDKFMGKEHDFSECQLFDKWKDGKIIIHKNCPFNIGPFGIATVQQLEDIDKYITCEVEK